MMVRCLSHIACSSPLVTHPFVWRSRLIVNELQMNISSPHEACWGAEVFRQKLQQIGPVEHKHSCSLVCNHNHRRLWKIFTLNHAKVINTQVNIHAKNKIRYEEQGKRSDSFCRHKMIIWPMKWRYLRNTTGPDPFSHTLPGVVQGQGVLRGLHEEPSGHIREPQTPVQSSTNIIYIYLQ